MARNKGVSGKTHTKQQLDDYANQHNPNNKAYKAKVTNQKQRTMKAILFATKKEAEDYIRDNYSGMDTEKSSLLSICGVPLTLLVLYHRIFYLSSKILKIFKNYLS